ncbi:hypothetical protein GCM10007424_12180 [Flavobacterium suaedae]|uniref:LysM domain-containing protein n=1 Tax=Flavobacterium suaedae TaxID=1767027 RepID=A0ABQ1JST6_9FLAO|nr:LysM domain-containing protein [Flavobacterium suaedae]GGB73851.1 hypothetical protein GCM10007424_12180 [Flavobacterium suaedae]
MRKNMLALVFLGLLSYNAAAQTQPNGGVVKEASEKIIIHKVALGETIVLIAKKYLVRPSDIYEINPDAVEGIGPGMLLKIPVDKALIVHKPKLAAKAQKVTKDNVHKLSASDIQERIEEDSDVTEETIVQTETERPSESMEVKTIAVPLKKTVETKVETKKVQIEDEAEEAEAEIEIVEVEEEIVQYNNGNEEVTPVVLSPAETDLPNNGVFTFTHTVEPAETLTGLARKYNTTVRAIEVANPGKFKNGLQIGQEVTIPAGPTPETVKGVVIHNVKQGETLHGLARQYNTTVEAIEAYNKRKLKHGLQTGQKISILPGKDNR